MNTESTEVSGEKKDRRRKVAAIFAAGSLVGVGAIITLAAWNDSEYTTGTFAAGTFGIEGSTDGTTWANHSTSGTAANLTFSVTPDNMAPGDVYYAPFSVREIANSSYDSTVTLQSPTTTGVVTNMTYTLVELASGDSCNAAGVSGGTAIVASGTAMTSASGTFNLTMGSPTTSAGAPVNLCYAVTAGSGLTQGQTGTVTWQFEATSN